jgi:cytochrome c-type biogenesis protein
MDPLSIALAAVAGVLSTLSPCVLPLLPAILIGARSEHRLGPLALAGGLALSFTLLGLLVATIGYSAGLTADHVRSAGGLVMVLVGVVLVVPAAQMSLASAASPVQNWVQSRFGNLSTSGPSGQFGLGALLGAVWAPCVGPTLGAASLLAAQGEDLAMVAIVMVAFGLGAALPILVLAGLSQSLARQSAAIARALSGLAKAALGVVLVLVGLLVLTGIDKKLEAALVEWSPEWLTRLTTSL